VNEREKTAKRAVFNAKEEVLRFVASVMELEYGLKKLVRSARVMAMKRVLQSQIPVPFVTAPGKLDAKLAMQRAQSAKGK